MMLHKLRRAMVNTAREQLHGEVEIDDTWIGGPQAGLRGSRQLKGRRAALVIVAVEKRERASGRIRMAVIPDFKATTLSAFIKENVAQGSTIYTDGLKSFILKESGFNHIPRRATAENRSAQGREIGGAIGRPRHRQLAAMADWHLPWGEPRSASGLPG
jgi:transposase-like protein